MKRIQVTIVAIVEYDDTKLRLTKSGDLVEIGPAQRGRRRVAVKPVLKFKKTQGFCEINSVPKIVAEDCEVGASTQLTTVELLEMIAEDCVASGISLTENARDAIVERKFVTHQNVRYEQQADGLWKVVDNPYAEVPS